MVLSVERVADVHGQPRALESRPKDPFLEFHRAERGVRKSKAKLNRLHGDQVTATQEQLHQYSEDAGTALFAYLQVALLEA